MICARAALSFGISGMNPCVAPQVMISSFPVSWWCLKAVIRLLSYLSRNTCLARVNFQWYIRASS